MMAHQPIRAAHWGIINVETLFRWSEPLEYMFYDSFGHPVAFLWTLAAVALTGYCIYRFDKRVMKNCGLPSDEDKRKIALTMAIVTAPWLFFIPIYQLY